MSRAYINSERSIKLLAGPPLYPIEMAKLWVSPIHVQLSLPHLVGKAVFLLLPWIKSDLWQESCWFSWLASYWQNYPSCQAVCMLEVGRKWKTSRKTGHSSHCSYPNIWQFFRIHVFQLAVFFFFNLQCSEMVMFDNRYLSSFTCFYLLSFII
jgi:hypothetical protein